jgi:hypothetical protein
VRVHLLPLLERAEGQARSHLMTMNDVLSRWVAYTEDQFMPAIGLFSHELALYNMSAHITQPSAVR